MTTFKIVREFIEDQFFNNKWRLLGSFVFIIGLYGLLCTVYSDIITQNENNAITLPYHSLFDTNNEMTLSQLTKKESVDNETEKPNDKYIFALDISASFCKTRIEDLNIKSHYRESIAEVNNIINPVKIYPKDEPTALDISKSLLFELLCELKQKNELSATKNKFAVWVIGDEGKLIYPKDRDSIVVNKGTIQNAIKEINNQNLDQKNTDFSNLISRITENEYRKDFGKNQRTEQEKPFIFFTIFSDFMHDISNRLKNNNKLLEDIEMNWEALENGIHDISYSRTMVNLFAFSKNGAINQHKTLFPLFVESNVDWYRLNRHFVENEISKKKRKEMIKKALHSVRTAEASMKFFYTRTNFIKNSSFFLRSTTSHNSIKLDLPEEINGSNKPRFSIFSKRLNAKGEGVRNSRRLVAGGSEHEILLEKNQKIQLIYSGKPPAYSSSPIMRIKIASTYETLLVPIFFIKRLPYWSSVIFIFLHASIIIVFTRLFILFRKEKKNRKPANSESIREQK